MNIQVLIASMYLQDTSLVYNLGIQNNYVVINQTDLSKCPNIQKNKDNKIFYSTEERGLSKSRNMALSLADADVCLLCDDDLSYYDNYEEIVSEAYAFFPDADVILFDFDESDSSRKRKSVAKKSQQLNYLQLLRGNSVRISFRLDSVRKKNITFNEYFGTGSGYFTAFEDILFLSSCYKSGLKIYYYNKSILKLHNGDKSSWFHGYNEQYFRNIGAFACKYASNLWLIYVLQYLFRHRQQYKTLGFIKSLKNAIIGKQQYKQLVNK